MWGRGKKALPGGYTDNVYRSRQSRGFESKSRCCCFYLTRSIFIIFLLVCLLSCGGLSALCVIFGYSQRWTYNVNRNVDPAYSIRTGWLYFSDNRMAPGVHQSLQTLDKATYILGIVAMAMQSLSVILAAFFALRALCGRVGRGFICIGVIYSILLIVAMGAYYIVAALEVWKWADRVVGASRVPWPDWAWGLGAGASLLWIISAGFASVLPKRHKYLDAEEDFQSSRIAPIRNPQPAARPVRAVSFAEPSAPEDSAYLPSSSEPPMPNGGLNAPLASLENPTKEVGEGKRRGFVPSWSRKGGVKPAELDAGNGAAFDAPSGTYRSRAEEIANRYRSRDTANGGNVELQQPSAPPPPPKSAW